EPGRVRRAVEPRRLPAGRDVYVHVGFRPAPGRTDRHVVLRLDVDGVFVPVLNEGTMMAMTRSGPWRPIDSGRDAASRGLLKQGARARRWDGPATRRGDTTNRPVGPYRQASPQRPGTAPAPGLRAGSDGLFLESRTAFPFIGKGLP